MSGNKAFGFAPDPMSEMFQPDRFCRETQGELCQDVGILATLD
ncbi:hypothetical protein RXV86_01510 [Alisedimentitalea sp. MJ-SS2]|nr:hypothetical protein [Alisedimentitalea sp. MJ-SS2]MDU8926053.1 hypothetical protein [Alisedimentitalea sp. MJ-SS2]